MVAEPHVETYDELEQFFAALAIAKPKDYTPQQRQSDFRAAFLGSEQGKRALYAIFEMCGLYRDPTAFVVDGDPPRRAFSNELTQQAIGRQGVARRIIHAMHAKFPARPEHTLKQEKK